MIRIRFFGPGELIQNYFRREQYVSYKIPLFRLFTFGLVKGNARCGRSQHRSTNQSVRVCQVNLATPKAAMNTGYLLLKKKTGEKDVPRYLPIFESFYACHCSKLSLSIFFFLGDQMFERFACHGLFLFQEMCPNSFMVLYGFLLRCARLSPCARTSGV